MTAVEIYAFYIAPLIVLGVGLLMYWVASRDTPEKHR